MRPELVGVYRYQGRSAVTFVRLTLALDGRCRVENWRDLGGWWDLRFDGTWTSEDDVVQLACERHVHGCGFLFLPLHVRRLDAEIRLVLEEDPTRRLVRLFGDHGRLRWFPIACFGDRGRVD